MADNSKNAPETEDDYLIESFTFEVHHMPNFVRVFVTHKATSEGMTSRPTLLGNAELKRVVQALYPNIEELGSKSLYRTDLQCLEFFDG